MRRNYPKEVRLQAVALNKEGLGAKSIGKALGIDSSVIKNWLKRYRQFGEQALQPYWREKSSIKIEDKPFEPKGPLHLYEKYKEALSLYIEDDHLSCSEICRRCGVSTKAFEHHLRRYYPQYIRSGGRKLSQHQKELKKVTKRRYHKAVKLYETTDLSSKEICEQLNLSITGFKRYINTYRRDLLMKRNDMQVTKHEADTIRLRRKGTGQTLPGHRKYQAAIEACDDVRYIEYNVSQIANEFHLDPSALGTQLRYHYPDVLYSRERERMRRGINDNLHRGARPWCLAQYADAIELLRTTEKTIRQVADECNVSFSGLRAHLVQYHKDVVALRAGRRDAARNSRKAGTLNGTGSVNRPRADKMEQYRDAVKLYRTTLLPLTEIARRTDVPLTGLTYHLYRWHRPLVLKRKGIRPTAENEYMDLSRTKHYLKSTKAKYAQAIQRLKKGEGASVSQVAAEFGFNPETFRDYISKHEPRLAKKFGRTTLNGKIVLARSSKKYEEAIHLYRTTTEPLKSIAKRLGLVYNSLSGFIRRNMPDAIVQHNALVEKMDLSNDQEMATDKLFCL